MLTTRPRGTSDIMPGEVEKWHNLEDKFREICREYGYAEIRTPVFEHTELFLRGVGDTTDIVEKEMYTFNDKGGRSVTLRPEGTAPAARAYLENRFYAGPRPVKLCYFGPMFRYDRPQAGRLRQFHQLGAEVFGSHDPAVDAEVIALAMKFYERLGLGGLDLHLNSVGCPQCRPLLRERLLEFFETRRSKLCKNCAGRLVKNPLRILDCKEGSCVEAGEGAPTSLDCLCDGCAEHFTAVKRRLELLGVPYTVDSRLVRGLDYYTHTAFEIMAAGIGAQSSIGGGGRYNGLVGTIGGPPTPGIGFALGVERIIMAMERQGLSAPPVKGPEVFVVSAGEKEAETAFCLLFKLRGEGLSADMDYVGRSLKSQMKYAGKTGARFVLIVGEEEMKQGFITVRDMAAGEQKAVPEKEVVEYLKIMGIQEVK